MTFQFDNPAPPRGHVYTAQRVLRIVTILVAVSGIAFLAWRWLNPPPAQRPAAAPEKIVVPEPAEEDDAGYDINLQNRTVRREGDNAAEMPTPTPDDNLSASAAAVGLDDVRDGGLIEPQPLYWLLRDVNDKHPADDLFMKRVPPVNLADLRTKPQDFRGKPVTVRGRVVRVERSVLSPNPSDIRAVLEGEIFIPNQGICSFLKIGRASCRERV